MNMATPLVLDQDNTLADVSGTLNTTRQQDTSMKHTDDADWYSLDIQVTGEYAFYMNLFEGTDAVADRNVEIKIYNEGNELIKEFSTGSFDEADVHIKEQFEIKQSGTYYIEIRRTKYSANYIFSIHPSIENGLVQNYEGEINDFMNMATPLVLDQDNTLADVNGNLNIARQQDNSIKQTDDMDWYSLNIQTIGIYTLDMILLEGTDDVANHDVKVKIYNEGNELIKEFSTGSFDEEGATITDTFDIKVAGTYFISIYRNKYTAEYDFSISLP